MTGTAPTLSPELVRQLEQLKDIHLPPDVGWWPLAPGWWVLAGVAVAAAIATVMIIHIHRRTVRYRALCELEKLRGETDLTDMTVAQRVALLLKRTALQTEATKALGVEHGDRWIELLTREPGGMSIDIACFIALAPYADASLARAAPERNSVLAAADHWIRRNV